MECFRHKGECGIHIFIDNIYPLSMAFKEALAWDMDSIPINEWFKYIKIMYIAS